MYTGVFFQSADVGQGNFLVQLIPFLLIFVIFWFLLIRPQRKRQQSHTAMLDSLKRGDTVITAGGIIGKVAKIGEDEVSLDVGEGVRLRVRRNMVVDRRDIGQAGPEKKADPEKKD